MKLKIILFLFCLVYSSLGLSQISKNRTHWMFGNGAYLDFSSQNSISKKTKLVNYFSSASYSNSLGELQLYSNGYTIFNGNHEIIADSLLPNKNNNTLIIPLKNNKYYVLAYGYENILFHKVDLNIDKIEYASRTLMSERIHAITAIKQEFSNKYWLLVKPDNSPNICIFLCDSDGIRLIRKNQISHITTLNNGIGEMISNFAGNKVALSYYYDSLVEVYKFDRKCGEMELETKIRAPEWHANPYGLEFSPNDQNLFIAWSRGQSMLSQYKTDNWGYMANCHTSNENINDVCVGIDNRLYLNVHVNDIPSTKVDLLPNPNQFGGGGTRVIENAIRLESTAAFNFPNFINCHANYNSNTNEIDKFKYDYSKSVCLGDLAYFNVHLSSITYDKIDWIIKDVDTEWETDELEFNYLFKDTGTYQVLLVGYTCYFNDTFNLEVKVQKEPSSHWIKDTTLCYGDTLLLTNHHGFDSVFINENVYKYDTLKLLPGDYQILLKQGACQINQNMKISTHPSLWSSLGKEYFICDIENETTKLDAGKGFAKYLWHPTSDTSQWIIVEEIGDYWVITDDFNGCSNKFDTKVSRRCDLDYYIPTAFSPNGDGINDGFFVTHNNATKIEMQIFNKWGQIVFKDSGSNVVWSPVNAQIGVYAYLIKIEGYYNKEPLTQFEKGIIHLIK